MIHVDRELAQRMERLITAEFHRICEVASLIFPGNSSQCLDVGDGVALWLGEGSPVNLAAGLGMSGPVPAGGLEHIETFYHERGADAVISACPYADHSLMAGLGRRGWRVSDFENLFILEVGGPLFPIDSRGGHSESGLGEDIDVRVCLPEERSEWARVTAQGFSNGSVPELGHMEFGHIMAEREEAILVLAWVDGEPAGTGSLIIEDGVGWLSGDATLPRFRRRGIQQEVQRRRLHLARDAGCELAVTEAVPGGASQRNMERLGFKLAYTHVEFAKTKM